jgi:hypothetical protein
VINAGGEGRVEKRENNRGYLKLTAFSGQFFDI